MSFLKRLLPAWLNGPAGGNAGVSVLDMLASHRHRVEPTLPPPTPQGTMRIHLFAGDFANKDAAWHYCFYNESARPEDLTRELPDAYIDTTHVETRFENYVERLAEFLQPADAARVTKQMNGANTLVIIAEPAFGGLAYALNNTSRLTYIGPLVVNV